MNPLPRFLALGLLVILAALSALLSWPTLRRSGIPTPPDHGATSTATASAPAVRAVEAAHRAAFPLALAGCIVALALAVSLGLRASRHPENDAAPSPHPADLGALARLAKTSVAQGEELAHERDVRQRAEADALLNQQLLNRSLEEKIRLGRDLHDGIIQSLYAAGLSIESARALARTDAVAADRQLAACRENLNQTIREVRAYIAGLAPENLRQANFADALKALVHELDAGRDVQFELRVDEAATAQLTPEQSIEALQIAREAVSNSLRHGQATRVSVRLHPGDGETCLAVQDNGRGFDLQSRRGTGHGLGNMHARAEHLGGRLRIESAPAGGTRVVFTLPMRTG
ncbi:sensor histidine kinase [Opitutus terrae]|uniref:Oxygen sensor histidine kinase NreB n=1 Tax=Opitutus terrae (strain DSM 11246 / JCM 15787 / PB90-1) TaxID=452637 RepID=B1ZXD3_OPITP|nr:sensor histidine kinase [Opitutus terrae]ACB76928.1 integral membrane sensor signal transduction histidine kinase [Opitutus terrae PB90-1]